MCCNYRLKKKEDEIGMTRQEAFDEINMIQDMYILLQLKI